MRWDPLENLLPPYNPEAPPGLIIPQALGPQGGNIVQEIVLEQRNRTTQRQSIERSVSDIQEKLYPNMEKEIHQCEKDLMRFCLLAVKTGK